MASSLSVAARLPPTNTTHDLKPPPHPTSIPSFPLPHTSHLSLSLSSSPSKQSRHPTTPTLKTSNSHDSSCTRSLLHGPSSSSDYVSLIESCTCLYLGRGVHGLSVKAGFGGHEFLETKLMQLYGKCGGVEDAALLFEKMPSRNVYAWAGIFGVYTDHGYFEEVIFTFQEMQFEGSEMEFFIFPVLLKACSGLNAPDIGKQLHGFVTKCEFVSNVYVGNALIDMYGKCGRLDDAKKVLKTMPQRDIVSWNSIITSFANNGMVFEVLECIKVMESPPIVTPNVVTWSAAIGGFAQNGYNEKALELFYSMQEAGVKPNARTLASVLPACARLQWSKIGKEIHGYILRHDYMTSSFVNNGLLDMYRRCGDMEHALNIFTKFCTVNLVSCNTMIVGYCENGEVENARELFDQMELNGVKRDSISWNSMISGYVDNGQFNEALMLFRFMQVEEEIEIDSFTLGSILTACANMETLGPGKEVHSCAITKGLQSNAYVGGALVEMYCRFGDMEAAQVVFNNIAEKDTATWNALISGYAQCDQMEHAYELLEKMREYGIEQNAYTWNGLMTAYLENEHNELALELFYDMQTRGLPSDIYTVGMVLHACSKLATIERGKQIHGYTIRYGYDMHVHIGATLVDMYAKCGTIHHAQKAFDRISVHNLVSRNSMLAGYAMHGHWKEGISFFHQMLQDGVRPDQITFMSVLSLCSHAGSVNEAYEFFNMMKSFGIEPNLKHYTCMVDLYSRAGRLQEACNLVKRMDTEPDAVVWSSLLSGCVIHGNVELGEFAARKLVEMDVENTGNYILLANLFASCGRWDDFARTWKIIKDKGMEKSPGYSRVEIKDQVHVFVASDRSHKNIDEIYATLEKLRFHIIEEDYLGEEYHVKFDANKENLLSTR